MTFSQRMAARLLCNVLVEIYRSGFPRANLLPASQSTFETENFLKIGHASPSMWTFLELILCGSAKRRTLIVSLATNTNSFVFSSVFMVDDDEPRLERVLDTAVIVDGA